MYIFSLDNGTWEWICRPLPELSLENLKAAGHLGEFNLGRAIPVSDRSLRSIRTDIRRLMAWARERL